MNDGTAAKTCGVRSVWIFARPLRFATILGSQFVSHGKYPFCHWGVLVTELDFDTVKQLLTDTDQCMPGCEDINVGDMWELFRRQDDKNEINVTKPFKISDVLETWNIFSAEKIGETKMSDDEIQQMAQHIMKEYGDYAGIENNCQRFVKYLVELISPGSFHPKAIESILDRLIGPDLVSLFFGSFPPVSPLHIESKRFANDIEMSPLQNTRPNIFNLSTALISLLSKVSLHSLDAELDDCLSDDPDYLGPDILEMGVR